MEKTEIKPIGVEAEHVSQLSCAGCQKVLDVSHLPSFTKIKCPECGVEQIVPAKFGAFLLIKQLGAGGMGVIYRAMDRELGRKVALKVMKKSLGDDPEFVKSFKHEAQAAAALNHRNVVQIYSFGQYNGQPYIVMELVDGGKLDDLIAGGVALDELKALEIHLEVAEGLKAASDVGLVHGDIKPANILFGINGEAKVVDFGLASYIGEQQKGGVWGTPYYIAPEKARAKKVDFRSDIYSLGATLFHVLAGKPPFDGPTANDVVMARLNQPAPNLLDVNPKINPETAKMVARMLELEPAMRYPSYPALLVDMRNALKSARKRAVKQPHIPIALPIAVSESEIKSLLKRLNIKIVAGIIAGILLIGAIIIGGVMYNRHQARLKLEAENRQMFQQTIENGRNTLDRIINLTGLIIETGTNIFPIAEKADKIAASINLVNDPTAVLMDETDKVKEGLNESEDLMARAADLIRQLEAAPDLPAAKRLSDELEAVFNRLITIHASMQESGELAKEVLPEATKQQGKTLEEINRIRSEKSREAARRREAENAKVKVQKQAEELKRTRPLLIQRELDIIDKCRGANTILISQRRFDEAARAFATIQSRITLDETKALFGNVMETYTEITKLKKWLQDAINHAPCKKCWIMGSSSHDIVKADNENGLTIALGAAGITKIQWEAVSVSQLIKMINYYLETAKLSETDRAVILKQTALLCYESGVFKTAETYANAAWKANPDSLADLNRLMPDIVSSEQE